MSGLWYNDLPALESKKTKSLIHPFVIKDYNGLTVNPYQGCQHRCAYCYATYEWSPEFYDRIYAKINAAEVLEGQLQKWKEETIQPVMVSSATDCYQPAELRFDLTRKCIKVLQKYNVPYYIFTKSGLIERDLELHRRYSDKCLIVWSITTSNERYRRVVEPGTPPSSRLFATIEKFTKAGIRCAVNVDPIIPLITDSEAELSALVENCRLAGLNHVFGAIMRLRADIWDRMKMVFKLLGISDGIPRYKEIYGFDDPVGSFYLATNKEYSKLVLSNLERQVMLNGMTFGFPDFLKPMKVDRTASGQTTLAAYIA